MNNTPLTQDTGERKEPLSIMGNFIVGLFLTPFISIILNSINIYRFGYKKATAWFIGGAYFLCLLFLSSLALEIGFGWGTSILIISICHVLFCLHQRIMYIKHFQNENKPNSIDSSRLLTIYGIIFGISLIFIVNLWSATNHLPTNKIFVTSSEPKQSSEGNESKPHTPLKFEHSGINGSYRVKLLGIRFSEGDSSDKPKEGFHYLILDAVIENIGTNQILVSTSTQFQLVDEQRFSYSYKWISLKDTNGNVEEYLPVEAKVLSTTSFMVPKNNDSFRILFSNPFETNEVIEWEWKAPNENTDMTKENPKEINNFLLDGWQVGVPFSSVVEKLPKDAVLDFIYMQFFFKSKHLDLSFTGRGILEYVFTNEPGKGLNANLKIGDNEQKIEKLLGKPKEQLKTTDEYLAYRYTFDTYDITVYSKDSSVQGITMEFTGIPIIDETEIISKYFDDYFAAKKSKTS
jgi:hypothetical protein